ncbi:MAG: anti-sigma factor family protein, partial [Vicinamibacterales bacterium]
MTTCPALEFGTLEQYFYGELTDTDTVRVEEHLRACESCRSHLADLHAVSSALDDRSPVDAPPAGDWSSFTHRLALQT